MAVLSQRFPLSLAPARVTNLVLHSLVQKHISQQEQTPMIRDAIISTCQAGKDHILRHRGELGVPIPYAPDYVYEAWKVGAYNVLNFLTTCTTRAGAKSIYGTMLKKPNAFNLSSPGRFSMCRPNIQIATANTAVVSSVSSAEKEGTSRNTQEIH